MRNTKFIAAALFLQIFTGYANEERQPEPAPNSGALSRAAAHPLIHEGLLTNPTEGLVIGNGDLAASVQIFSNELKLNLGKNDVWDTRYNSPSKTVDVAVTHDELIAYVEEHGAVSAKLLNKPKQKGEPVFHSPLRVGAIRIAHPGWSGTKVSSKVRIDRGTLEAEYQFPSGTLRFTTFIHREKNIVMLRASAEGQVPWFTIIVEREPGITNGELPPLRVKNDPKAFSGTLSQTVPGLYETPPFSWHVAASFPDQTQLASVSRAGDVVSAGRFSSQVQRVGWSLRQNLALRDGASINFALGVATDTDGSTPALDRACKLAGNSGVDRFEQELGTHTAAWKSFWDASAISIEDQELEALWYRGLFSYACHLSPGAQAPGLNANIPISDQSPYKGKYTWNHNVQKWFFPALSANHPEWYDVLADLIAEQTPTFKHLAKTIFGLEGVYVDLSGRPRPIPERATSSPVVGRALSHTGWLASMLFDHYSFTGDTDWLKTRAYPFLRETANFYAAYLEKYQGEDLAIYPSLRLEDLWSTKRNQSWGKNFLGNKNNSVDLMMFRKAFKDAIAAAEILGADSAQRKRWSRYLKRVPEIEYGWRNGQAWYAICKDWEKAWPNFEEYLEHLRHSRWGCQAWPVFPGDYIDGDEEGGLAAVLRDLVAEVDLLDLRPHTTVLGTFHGEATVMPFIRLGMMDKFDDIRSLMLAHQYPAGQFSPWRASSGQSVLLPRLDQWRLVENQYMQILGVSEMLLQSQSGILRLFPYWPEDKAAAFHDLRARGAFLVSAERAPGTKLRATIHSLRGNTCRLRWNQAGSPTILQKGEPVPFVVEGRDLVFDTQAGAVYSVDEE
ncbi:MAG: hypothetical protein HOI67_05530 [Gammaproteobacteria bacterium]|nr:hypothetical protein [Gammaproteobacteria bacterium]